MLPHLLLPDMAAAITGSRADRLVVLNLAAQPGETEGFSPEQHLDVLSAHAPNLRVDSVLADRASVALPQRLASAATRLGARLDLHDVAVPGTARHDPSKLSVSLAAVLTAGHRQAVNGWALSRVTGGWVTAGHVDRAVMSTCGKQDDRNAAVRGVDSE